MNNWTDSFTIFSEAIAMKIKQNMKRQKSKSTFQIGRHSNSAQAIENLRIGRTLEKLALN